MSMSLRMRAKWRTHIYHQMPLLQDSKLKWIYRYHLKKTGDILSIKNFFGTVGDCISINCYIIKKGCHILRQPLEKHIVRIS